MTEISAPGDPGHPTAALPQGQDSVRVMRVVGLILVALLLCGGTASMVNSFATHTVTRTTAYPGAARSVSVNVTTGDITVHVATATQQPRVTTRVRESFADGTVTFSVQNGVLTLTGTCHGSPRLYPPCVTDVDLVVPPGTAVDLRSTLGDIGAFARTGPSTPPRPRATSR